jgi:hypothetical protein
MAARERFFSKGKELNALLIMIPLCRYLTTASLTAVVAARPQFLDILIYSNKFTNVRLITMLKPPNSTKVD